MTNKTYSDLKIAILHTGPAIAAAVAEHGDYDDMCKTLIKRRPDQADTFTIFEGIFPESIDPYDGFVITGSKHGAYEDHDWIAPLEDLIRDIYQSEKKLLGICFGHQIIAQALGGKVEKSDKGFGIGVMEYDLLGDDQEAQNDQTISLYAWHQDQVVSCPPNADIIASSEFCPIAGLRFGETVLTYQAHPEFTAGYMKSLTAHNQGKLPGRLIEDAKLSLDRPVHAKTVQDTILEFMNS